MKMTFAMVARSLFGAQLKDEDIDLVSHTICTVQEFIVRQTLQPYLNPWFAVSGELRRHEEMRARADGILIEYIKQRRHQAPGHDLLQTLMDARYSDGEGMSDELVLSESMQLLVAGHETSSNALSWLFYLLSSRPDCLERVRQEFDSVLGDAPLSYADVPRFEFTTQVIQEALRLYPPFWMIDREAVADDRAGDIDIPRGSTVIVFVYGAHHAPRYWQNPESFDPERFTKANEKLQHALHLSALRRRTARLHRRQLRDAANSHDSERSAQKIRFPADSRPDDRSSPDGDPAAEARNSHDLYRGIRTRPSRSPSVLEIGREAIGRNGMQSR